MYSFNKYFYRVDKNYFEREDVLYERRGKCAKNANIYRSDYYSSLVARREICTNKERLYRRYTETNKAIAVIRVWKRFI